VEQVREANAGLQAARVLWIPSIVAGVGYNKHDGRIQATEGDVLEVSRNSLYAGGGPVISDAPLTGGSSGPARLFADLSTADVLFEPLVARQTVRQASMSRAVTFNDTLLQASVTYLALVKAAADGGIAAEAVANAQRLTHLTEQFAKAGTGLEADHQRALADVAARQRQVLQNQEQIHVVSAELARQLRLDPSVLLSPADGQPAPIELIDDDIPLDDLISQGVGSRPEAALNRSMVAETAYRVRQECVRPWLPHLYVGFSGGGFGGGQSTYMGSFSDRTDFDAVATWELENFGLGNHAMRRQRASQNRQARLSSAQVRDAIAAEVSRAFYQVRFRGEQIDVTQSQVQAAAEALELNFRGIRGGELRAIEAQQAIGAIASARQSYVEAVVAYNQAQFALLRAVGEPPYAP
jgi:outer membrane protein TolC